MKFIREDDHYSGLDQEMSKTNLITIMNNQMKRKFATLMKRQKLEMTMLCCWVPQKMVIKKNIKYKARRKLTNQSEKYYGF